MIAIFRQQNSNSDEQTTEFVQHVVYHGWLWFVPGWCAMTICITLFMNLVQQFVLCLQVHHRTLLVKN